MPETGERGVFLEAEVGEQEIEAVEQNHGLGAGLAEVMEPIDFSIEVVVEMEKFLVGLQGGEQKVAVVVGLGVVVGGEDVEIVGVGGVPEQEVDLVAGPSLPEAGQVAGVGVGVGEKHNQAV